MLSADEVVEATFEDVSAAFEFDTDFQEKIAALSIRDGNFARRTDGLISPAYFESESVTSLVWMAQDYFQRYKSLPASKAIWVNMIKEAIVSRHIREDMRHEVIDTLRRLLKTSLSDRDYIIDRVSEFARHQAVQNAVAASIDLADKKRFDDISDLFAKAAAVGAHTDFVDVDYWNGIEARTQYRKDVEAGIIKPNGVSTGIPKLDRLLYHRGWGRKELSVIMAGPKAGKSLTLGDAAIRASLAGFNVLYLTLEVSTDIITDRMDANVSGTKMDELQAKLHEVEEKVRGKSRRPKRGELRCSEFPSGTLSPSGIRRVLEKHKSEGRVFDLIIVDYADIMRPDTVTGDPIENSKQVWLGLRAIAGEEDAAMLTATQTNRDGAKSDTAKAEHASEDFNKIRIADLVISLNATDEEKASGDARLFFAASRNQGGAFTVAIKRDLEKMRAITSIVSVT